MAMSPDLDDEVALYESILLTLEPTNTSAGSEDITRKIRLTTDNHTVKVGRASKTVSKGLVPATTNAFFDSPVVSRSHAEISANFIDGSISVTDMGSLHGTFINEKQLEKNVPSTLEQDDIVSFGIHVSRGLDVFYPTSCAVGLVRTPVKPAERARSYCAPDSDDGLSEASVEEYDSDSVHSVDVQFINGRSVTTTAITTYEIEDSDSSSDDDAASVEEIEICPEMETLPPLGIHTKTEDHHLSDEANEDEADEDEDDGEDFGEADEVEEDDEDGEDEDDEEDEDAQDDDDEEEEEEEQEADDENLAQQPDVIDDFLLEELNGFAKNSPPSPLEKEATPANAEESLEAHGLWTPPSITADDVAALSRIAESTFQAEIAASNEAAVADNGKLQLLSDSLPRSVASKFDISSLLNPSPPTSSPAKEQATDNSDIPTAYPGMASFEVYEHPNPPVSPSTDNVDEGAMMKIDTVINQNPTPPPVLAPIVSDLNSLATHAGLTSMGQRSGVPSGAAVALAVAIAEADADETWEGIVDDEEDNADDSPAMTSAASYLQYKKQRASKKRKADEMLVNAASDAGAAAVDSTTEAPSAKRPATPAAMAAKRSKSRGWAFAEKIGIAALGGAVVLGSLIYTAPSF